MVLGLACRRSRSAKVGNKRRGCSKRVVWYVCMVCKHAGMCVGLWVFVITDRSPKSK